MSEYAKLFEDAINVFGLKKILTEVLSVGKVINKGTVGQLTIHINCGGVTKICQDKWEIK